VLTDVADADRTSRRTAVSRAVVPIYGYEEEAKDVEALPAEKQRQGRPVPDDNRR
jgi:hypothetical protein